jgi:hypothetical protein
LGSSLLFLFEEGTGNFYFNVLWLILGFYSPYLQKVLGMVSFGLQIFVTSKQHVTACERCAGETEDECFVSCCLQYEDYYYYYYYYYTLYPLMCCTCKYHTGADLADRATVSSYYSVTENTL